MKKILVVGKNSYIGKSFGFWINDILNSCNYEINYVGTKSEEWIKKDFTGYDSILHVAGMAHKKETSKNERKYYEVNHALAVRVAEKAKNSGVKHFIFLSSMSIYGKKNGIIDENLIPKPQNYYGMSKLAAEKSLKELESNDFKVAYIRPPMVYGEKCPGNYKMISKVAVLIPIFPSIRNKRSMIFIYNLCEFIRLVIDRKLNGVFHPQNKEYVSTEELYRTIRKQNDKKTSCFGFLNPVLHANKINVINKIFGDLVYSKEISNLEMNYNVYDFETSVNLSEKGIKNG